jgi:hypothetical protein
MIKRGKLRIFRLISLPGKARQVDSSKAVETSAKPSPIGGKIVMHRIIVGVTSATLLFCAFGMAGGQAQNGDKDFSHPAFRILNGSRANPRITLTELLDSYEKAVGGKEAVEKIRTVVAHEERRAEANPGDWRVGSCVEYFKFPNKRKSVLTIRSGSKNVTAYDGETAWYDSPSGGIEQGSPEENALAAQELNLLNLLHMREAFPQMTLIGSSKVEGRDVYVVDVSLEGMALHRSLFFDAETRLLIGSIVAQPLADQTQIIEQIYSDFRFVHGVKLPFAVRAIEYNQHTSMEIKRTRIDCNIPLRDDFFSVNSTTAEKSGI